MATNAQVAVEAAARISVAEIRAVGAGMGLGTTEAQMLAMAGRIADWLDARDREPAEWAAKFHEEAMRNAPKDMMSGRGPGRGI